MNILHRQMQQVNNALSLIKDYEPFLDSDGKQICTTLADGVVLEWRQFLNCNIVDKSNGGISITKVNDYTIHIEGTNIIEGNNYIMFVSGTINLPTVGHYIYTTGVNGGGGSKYDIRYWDKYPAYQRDNISLIEISPGSQLNVMVRKNASLNADAIISAIDITTLFTHHPNLLPTTADAFKAMMWSEGTESDKQLGYTAYSAEAESVIVYKGKLYKIPV